MATKFITVSIDIMHDKNLSPNQKFILAEIIQLTSLEDGCYASNKHFSELIGITTQGVSKAINQLAKDGYITIDNAQSKRNFGRVITINSGKSAINSGLESKENKTNNGRNQDLDGFENLWKDYTLTFLKRANRGGGSKKLAKEKYLKLRKTYSHDEIYSFVEKHSSLSIGHKNLENLLTPDRVKQYFEDAA